MQFYSVHQNVNADGSPLVQGSQVRMPDGSPMPNVLQVEVIASPERGLWIARIDVPVRLGEPVSVDTERQINPFQQAEPDRKEQSASARPHNYG